MDKYEQLLQEFRELYAEHEKLEMAYDELYDKHTKLIALYRELTDGSSSSEEEEDFPIKVDDDELLAVRKASSNHNEMGQKILWRM